MASSAQNQSVSVGIVETKQCSVPLPPEGFVLQCGRTLPELTVAYETYGTLSPLRDNVVLICHALSGDAHVAGYHSENAKPGWWEEMVGPGKGIDTGRFFVVCSNILGGCSGATGPGSINPATGRPYGSEFPSIAIADIVRVEQLFLRQLGIDRLAAVIGGSFGGMQVLEWSIQFPDMVDRCICIASAASLAAQALAFDIVGRRAILADADWQGEDYYGTGRVPGSGLAQARMVGHITYLSPEMMTRKFGREKKETSEPQERFTTLFQVESYLQYQGAKFVERFDANSYLHITEAMDQYDLAEASGSISAAFGNAKARFLIVALSSDWLFPPEQSLEIATALIHERKRISYCLLRAPHGHDAFLVDIERLAEVVRTFLLADARPADPAPAEPPVAASTPDFLQIQSMVRPGSRVLDLGCGDGDLLARLATGKNASGLGIEIDLDHMICALGRGLDVFQGDIDEGLAMIPDQAYDYVILSETLQVVRRPQLVLREMLRVGRQGIVSFPNFAHWTNRLALGFSGRMPKSRSLPYEWYETPNIHLATLHDFTRLCQQDGIRILETVPLSEGAISRGLIRLGCTNLGADRVLIRIGRE